MNGELLTAKDSLVRAFEESKKLWDKGEVRLSSQEVSDKRSALKEIVNLAGEVASILARFELISK